LKELLRLDRAWLPERPGHSIYIRPYAFASDTSLGVHKTNATTLAVILSPVGPYFKTGAAATPAAGQPWLNSVQCLLVRSGWSHQQLLPAEPA
jgi:branched-subunit amino acid aminotransferase/4-amino-4-deoxychorismate lyase